MPVNYLLALLYCPFEAQQPICLALHAGLRPERRPRGHGRVARVYFERWSITRVLSVHERRYRDDLMNCNDAK